MKLILLCSSTSCKYIFLWKFTEGWHQSASASDSKDSFGGNGDASITFPGVMSTGNAHVVIARTEIEYMSRNLLVVQLLILVVGLGAAYTIDLAGKFHSVHERRAPACARQCGATPVAQRGQLLATGNARESGLYISECGNWYCSVSH